jgi:hypothetical protein
VDHPRLILAVLAHAVLRQFAHASLASRLRVPCARRQLQRPRRCCLAFGCSTSRPPFELVEVAQEYWSSGHASTARSGPGPLSLTSTTQHCWQPVPLLPTLQEWCCHHPCKARFRLAGLPLRGGSRTLWITMKGFQIIIPSPFSGFILALGKFHKVAHPRTLAGLLP